MRRKDPRGDAARAAPGLQVQTGDAAPVKRSYRAVLVQEESNLASWSSFLQQPGLDDVPTRGEARIAELRDTPTRVHQRYRDHDHGHAAKDD